MYLVSHKFNLFLAKRKYNHHCANFITQFGFFVSVMNPLETVKYSTCHMMMKLFPGRICTLHAKGAVLQAF